MLSDQTVECRENIHREKTFLIKRNPDFKLITSQHYKAGKRDEIFPRKKKTVAKTATRYTTRNFSCKRKTSYGLFVLVLKGVLPVTCWYAHTLLKFIIWSFFILSCGKESCWVKLIRGTFKLVRKSLNIPYNLYKLHLLTTILYQRLNNFSEIIFVWIPSCLAGHFVSLIQLDCTIAIVT